MPSSQKYLHIQKQTNTETDSKQYSKHARPVCGAVILPQRYTTNGEQDLEHVHKPCTLNTRGVMKSSFHKIYGLAVHTKNKGVYFRFIHPGTRFKKINAGSVWTKRQYDTKCFTYTAKCVSMCTGLLDYLWIIVMFLSAVRTLILTAPIHCR